MSSDFRKQRGFSLIEILLVLGLIAIMAIAAFVIYPRVRDSQAVNATVAQYVLINSSIKDFFGDKPYTGLTAATAVSAGVLTAPDLITNWGTVTLAVPTARTFRIDFNTVPYNICKRLVSRVEGNAQAITVGATVVKSSTVAYNALTGPTACGLSGTTTIQVTPL